MVGLTARSFVNIHPGLNRSQTRQLICLERYKDRGMMCSNIGISANCYKTFFQRNYNSIGITSAKIIRMYTDSGVNYGVNYAEKSIFNITTWRQCYKTVSLVADATAK
jgi:hypothetical protein